MAPAKSAAKKRLRQIMSASVTEVRKIESVVISQREAANVER
jgi:hypothetical protein